jgi:hypothetical protein
MRIGTRFILNQTLNHSLHQEIEKGIIGVGYVFSEAEFRPGKVALIG